MMAWGWGRPKSLKELQSEYEDEVFVEEDDIINSNLGYIEENVYDEI